ncbi:MAG TPA: hypothetical protein VK815_12350 [Candidatus Acidoferrales bacterium]|jgi:hypothetical protein|nr:hypothetical protein [Candidatus Acidoferrales bacterium]
MKLPISYIFTPAQEFTVRIAAAAQEMTWRQSPVWITDGGQDVKHRTVRHKHRGRMKYRRLVLQLEAV